MAIGEHERAVSIVLIDFPIAEQVASPDQFFDVLYAALVVTSQVISIREMKWIILLCDPANNEYR